MSLYTDEEIRKIWELSRKFGEEYKFKSLGDYVNGCGYSAVGFQDPNDKDNKALCITVLLNRSLPADVKLPDEYEGVKVFCQVIGLLKPVGT